MPSLTLISEYAEIIGSAIALLSAAVAVSFWCVRRFGRPGEQPPEDLGQKKIHCGKLPIFPKALSIPTANISAN